MIAVFLCVFLQHLYYVVLPKAYVEIKKLVTRKPSTVDKAALTRKFNKEMEKMLGQICVVINTKQSLDDKISQIRGLFETLDEHNAVRLGYVRQHSDKDNNILRLQDGNSSHQD